MAILRRQNSKNNMDEQCSHPEWCDCIGCLAMDELQEIGRRKKTTIQYRTAPINIIVNALANRKASDYVHHDFDKSHIDLLCDIISNADSSLLDKLLDDPLLMLWPIETLTTNIHFSELLFSKAIQLAINAYDSGIIELERFVSSTDFLIGKKARFIRNHEIIETLAQNKWTLAAVFLNRFTSKKLKRQTFKYAVHLLENDELTEERFAFHVVAPMANQLSDKEMIRLIEKYHKIGLCLSKLSHLKISPQVAIKIWELSKSITWPMIHECKWMPVRVLEDAYEKWDDRMPASIATEFVSHPNISNKIMENLWNRFKHPESPWLDQKILQKQNCSEKLATEILCYSYEKRQYPKQLSDLVKNIIPRQKYNELIEKLETMRKLRT